MELLANSLHDDDENLLRKLVIINELVHKCRNMITLSNDETWVVLAEADINIDSGQNMFVSHISVNYNNYIAITGLLESNKRNRL
jgi:hypothetical protein